MVTADSQPTPENAELNQTQLEAKRLELEEKRFDLEQRRMLREEAEQKNNERFFRKHAGEVLAGAVTLAGILVSAANIWVAYIEKGKEIGAQEIQKHRETELLAISTKARIEQEKREEDDKVRLTQQDYDHKWKLDMLQFVDKHSEQIFSTQSKDIDRIRDVMVVCFPPKEVSALFEKLKTTAPGEVQRKAWEQGAEAAVQLTGEAKVADAGKLPENRPPSVSAGIVPTTATSCQEFGVADGIGNKECRFRCWDTGHPYNVSASKIAESAEECAAVALRRCRQAGNSFCGYAWGKLSEPQ